MKHLIRYSILCLIVTVGTSAFAEEAKNENQAPSKEAAKSEETAGDKEIVESEDVAETKPKEKDGKKDADDKKGKDNKKVKKPKKGDNDKPATHTVEKGPMKITVELSGVFEAQAMHEMVLRLEQWSELRVLDAVEHGRRVKRGDLLVTLDMDKIDRAIDDLRGELHMNGLEFKLAEERLRLLKATTPLDLAEARRRQRIASEDLKRFLEIGGPMEKKRADFMLKAAKQYLEYEEEELQQLEKMYKADDLTEETEEIVLKRARNEVEKAKFFVEMYKVMHEKTLRFDLPRREEHVKESAGRADLQLNRANATLPLELKKQKLKLDKMKVKRTKLKEKLDELSADRKAMIVKSPADGVVYYGKCTRGKFSDATSIADKFRRGGRLSTNSVFMTVVGQRPIFVRADVKEKQLQYIRAGIKGVAKPTGYPDVELIAIVDRVDTVPISSGRFGSRITVELDQKAKCLAPGMTCKVKFVPYKKKNALTVPPKAVIADEWDEKKHYVYVLDKDGKPKKQFVKVGKRTEKKVEILSGISKGDKVLLERPKKK